mmetsp:Transcript_22975/g.51104  ORF Transcript_22975/g.51104 Transcript_22975/m.51104 type:complete len:94 (+) Transcript_22975:442-723(+)
MKGFTLSKYNEKTKEVIRNVSFLGNNFYPEMMHKTFFINCPMVFNICWKAVSVFVDEGTKAKIEFLGSHYQDTLKKWIDEDKLITEYGGKSEF